MIGADRFLALHVTMLHRAPDNRVVFRDTYGLQFTISYSFDPSLSFLFRIHNPDHVVQSADAMD